MSPYHYLVIVSATVAAIALPGTSAFAPAGSSMATCHRTSSLNMVPMAKGCAAKPFEKKKIAVFGAGGYLGAVVFGFLQRAASIYGTGISAGSSPRGIFSTSGGSEALNKVLGPSFKLAYAGEDLVRLVDTKSVAHIKERVKGFDGAILGTAYQLEKRSVTLNTYEKAPNDKTFEIYLDEKYGAWEDDVPSNDSDIHLTIFRNSIRACKEAGICHVVVVETHRTLRPMDFVNILEDEGVAYTYIRTDSSFAKDINYTFEKGISNKLAVTRVPEGTQMTPFDASASDQGSINREDMAALMVQCLLTLDWKESRILDVSPSSDSTISSGYGGKRMKGLKFDKEWCPNSEFLAESLAAL
ncbi:hypothetical protein ACHAWF_017966 [Thalassiosira exigua]